MGSIGVEFDYALIGCLAHISADYDHVWFVFDLVEPTNLTGVYGRPLHHPIVFVLYSLLLAAIFTALFVRRVQSTDESGDDSTQYLRFIRVHRELVELSSDSASIIELQRRIGCERRRTSRTSGRSATSSV